MFSVRGIWECSKCSLSSMIEGEENAETNSAVGEAWLLTLARM